MLTQKLFLFFLSMVPVIELRGAIPLGMAWGIPMWQTYLISVIGNILPVPILVVFARRVLFWCATWPKVGHFFQKIIDIGNRKIRLPHRHPAADETAPGLLCHLPGRSHQRHHHVAGLQRRIRIPVPVRLIRHHRPNSFLALPGNLLSAKKDAPPAGERPFAV